MKLTSNVSKDLLNRIRRAHSSGHDQTVKKNINDDATIMLPS